MTTDFVTGDYYLLEEIIQAANALVYQEFVYSGEMPRPAITAGFLPQKLPPHFRDLTRDDVAASAAWLSARCVIAIE